MKKTLLMTTALVALTCGHNAFAENLPTDATNLTSGSYVVERSDTQVSHSGDINLSGTASLDVKTQAIVEEDINAFNTLNVSGNVSLADDASLSVINSNAADDTEKPFMFVDGKYTQTGGELTLKQENEAEWRATLNAKEANISGGKIKLDTGEIFIYGDAGKEFNISGGMFEMNNSNISTYPAASAEGNSQKGAAMTVSGGTFKMNESSLGRENSGDLDISGGEFTLENGSAIFHDGETGNINISDGTISLKDSSIVRGGDYQSEDGKPASGDINITGGTIIADNSEISNNGSGSLNIKNGTVNTVKSELHGKGIEVSGGNITLNGTDFTNDDLAKSFKLTDGTIVMNGNHSVIGTNHGDGNDVTTGKFEMTGGKISVNGTGNYIEGGDISVSGGTIDIAQGSVLQAIATLDENDNPGEVSTLELSGNDTKINLGGKLVANIGGPDEAEGVLERDGEGVGLFRSEFLFMESDAIPSEEAQFEAYKKVAETLDGKPVIIRTLDIGGDKALPYLGLPTEENPFLGFRAVRFCLQRKEDIYKPQLRALLRASAFGKVRIMVPLVTCVDELRAVKAIIEELKQELDAEGIAYDKDIQVGVMMETAAASLIADILAKEADFFSIGTNDLTGYTMAADRGNPDVAYLYSAYNPAVLRSIRNIISAANKEDIMAGMCGEAASDPLLVPVLLGFGLNEFSVSATAILATRKVMSLWTMDECKALVDEVMQLETEAEVKALLEERARS